MSERATTHPLERPPLWPVFRCPSMAGFEVSTEEDADIVLVVRMEVRPVVRRRRLGKHADDDFKEPRDLWHRRPPSLDKAALSLTMGNALTTFDLARAPVVLGGAAVLSSLPRHRSPSVRP